MVRVRGGDNGSRGWKDAATRQERGQPLEAGEVKITGSFLESPERNVA